MLDIFSWGRGEDGQLGLGDTSDQSTPVLVENLRKVRVREVACGSGHTIVLTREGQVLTWGRGDDGRLGHGDNGWKYIPRPVKGLEGLRRRRRKEGGLWMSHVDQGQDSLTHTFIQSPTLFPSSSLIIIFFPPPPPFLSALK